MSTPSNDKGRLVEGFGHVLVVVENLDAARKTWTKLGFELSGVKLFQSCTSAGFRLEGAGLTLVEAPESALTPLADAARARLRSHGPGVFGWTWLSADAAASAKSIGQGVTNAEGESDGEALRFNVPSSLTPGAFTMIESDVARPSPVHGNKIDSADHVVLMCRDARATADCYANAFNLKPRKVDARGKCYCFVKVGKVVLEIVSNAPHAQPGSDSGKSGTGSAVSRSLLWGMAFHSLNLDATTDFLASADVALKPTRAAVQGGRILEALDRPSGVAVAVMGK